MSTIKPELFQLCKEVASELEGWSFGSDMFKNKDLKHTDLIVWPAFSFQGGGENPMCNIQPSICVVNKKSIKLFQQIFGVKPYWTSIIGFQTVRNELRFYPEDLRILGNIWRYRQKFTDTKGQEIPWRKEWVALDEARPVLTGMMKDGIDLINKYYDLSSEENFLRNLPLDPKVVGHHGIEKGSGVMLCVTRILLGDFDFVEKYRSDDFKTMYPKHYKELDAIIAALPELKVRFEETGKVI
jgi:hypothetical protein